MCFMHQVSVNDHQDWWGLEWQLRTTERWHLLWAGVTACFRSSPSYCRSTYHGPYVTVASSGSVGVWLYCAFTDSRMSLLIYRLLIKKIKNKKQTKLHQIVASLIDHFHSNGTGSGKGLVPWSGVLSCRLLRVTTDREGDVGLIVGLGTKLVQIDKFWACHLKQIWPRWVAECRMLILLASWVKFFRATWLTTAFKTGTKVKFNCNSSSLGWFSILPFRLNLMEGF